MSTKKPFKLEIKGHVAWLTLDCPEKLNAMGLAFFEQLTNHFKKLDQDPDVRVVVICAKGKHFTTGLDLMEAGSMLTGKGADDRETFKQKIHELQQSNNCIEKCRKPVIAAINGYCIGSGVDLLSACDIRIACNDAVFSIRETRIAIVADLGTLQRLPHIIGHGWFRELALTGRDFTAEEALNMGFVTRVCRDKEALLDEAGQLASQISSCAPLTVQGVKEVINYSRDYGVHAGLDYVAQQNAAALPSDDLMEAVTAFMEKRDPVFKGR